MSKTQKTDWQAIIRQAIKQSGQTSVEIARQTGVSRSQISRFLRGERTLTIPTAEKIGKLLGLELRKKEGGRLK